jgi:hypothetical protein
MGGELCRRMQVSRVSRTHKESIRKVVVVGGGGLAGLEGREAGGGSGGVPVTINSSFGSQITERSRRALITERACETPILSFPHASRDSSRSLIRLRNLLRVTANSPALVIMLIRSPARALQIFNFIIGNRWQR